MPSSKILQSFFKIEQGEVGETCTPSTLVFYGRHILDVPMGVRESLVIRLHSKIDQIHLGFTLALKPSVSSPFYPWVTVTTTGRALLIYMATPFFPNVDSGLLKKIFGGKHFVGR